MKPPSATAISVLALIVSLGTLSVQDPDMSLSVHQGTPLYPSQRVHIECIAVNTSYLSWSSSEYVGAITVEIRENSPPMTTEMGADIQVLPSSEGRLASRLEFNVTTNSSVVCRNVDQEREDVIHIHSTGVNATELTIVSEQETYCSGDTVEMTCTAKESEFLEWEVDGQPVSQCRSLGTVGVPQTTCGLNVTLHEGVNRVTCVNGDVRVTNTTEILVADTEQCRGDISNDVTHVSSKATVEQFVTGVNFETQGAIDEAVTSVYSGGLILGTLCAALLAGV